VVNNNALSSIAFYVAEMGFSPYEMLHLNQKLNVHLSWQWLT